MFHSPGYNGGVTGGNYTAKTLKIPPHLHGALIGKGGENISPIRQRHGVRIDFPGRESYDDSVTVSGKEQDVDAAIEELSKRVASLSAEEKVEVEFPSYMCRFFRHADLDARLQEIGRKHGIRLTTPNLEHSSWRRPYIAIRGHDPNLSACKREVQLLFTILEAQEAEKIKKKLDEEPQPSGSDALSLIDVFARLSDSTFVKDYYAEGNQQKLKEFREGNADWKPVPHGDDNLFPF